MCARVRSNPFHAQEGEHVQPAGPHLAGVTRITAADSADSMIHPGVDPSKARGLLAAQKLPSTQATSTFSTTIARAAQHHGCGTPQSDNFTTPCSRGSNGGRSSAPSWNRRVRRSSPWVRPGAAATGSMGGESEYTDSPRRSERSAAMPLQTKKLKVRLLMHAHHVIERDMCSACKQQQHPPGMHTPPPRVSAPC